MWNDESAALYCAHQKKNEGKKAPTNSKTQQGKTVSQIISKGNNDIPKDAGSSNRDRICTFLVSESNKLNSF